MWPVVPRIEVVASRSNGLTDGHFPFSSNRSPPSVFFPFTLLDVPVAASSSASHRDFLFLSPLVRVIPYLILSLFLELFNPLPPLANSEYWREQFSVLQCSLTRY